MQETQSTCPYCGVGCGVIIETRGGAITGVRGDPSHPANHGKLCTKGSTLHLTAAPAQAAQARLLVPQLRARRDAEPAPIAWSSAITHAAERLEGIVAAHGPDALGFYLSGQLLTEDYYVFNKLAKGLIGTNNIDTNSRLCMSSAVAGYKATLGADAPPACYDDFQHAGCLFIAGSNMAWAHPVAFRRVEAARAANPQMKIIVVDPRRTETAAVADLHLPLAPGTDVMLFHGLLHIMLREGWVDEAYIDRHTRGFAELKALVRDAVPGHVAAICGLNQDDLLRAARWFALGGDATPPDARRGTLSLYCQGLNQSSSGTDKNAALINLHLATGQIGRAGAGPFSLTGQPNAMGGREVGGLSNLLSAHRDMGNPAHRAEVAALWGVERVPDQPGKAAVEMFEAAADGEIKALWIACTNPAQSLPRQSLVREALRRAEFVVLQEAFAHTATAAFADLLLPATTWGEKLGTVTNSERRISRVRAAVPPSGEARHDWQIGVQLAQALETRLRAGRPSLFPYDTVDAQAGAEAIWNEHRESTRGRDLDITGLSWSLLDERGPQQWPFAQGAASGKARLYEDGVFPTPDGRALFQAQPYRALAEPCDARYPFSLNTGRLRDHWHGMSRTGQLGRLFAHESEPQLQMHPADMDRLQLKNGDLAHVTSRRGAIVAPVRTDAQLSSGQVFLAMHWGSEYLGGRSSTGQRLGGVNALTTPERCPKSRQPELKHAAVKVLKAQMPWHCLGMAWLPADGVLQAREALAALMGEFDFASCVLFSNAVSLAEADQARTGVQFRAAAYEAPSPDLLQRLSDCLQLSDPQALRYTDARRQCSRTLRLVQRADQRVLEGFMLCGDASAGQWLADVLKGGLSTLPFGRMLLASGSSAPRVAVGASRQVCACMNVSEDAIVRQLKTGAGGSEDACLQALKDSLGCGTGCGSCIPSIRQMVRSLQPQALGAPA
ncbi:molybdopterin-dependent oxidoreductase [Diaphorobacter ruginosibacter]|uniref:Molybdopterin-dependent oxidoreductase n=1 Tax=Diaphorobacter ruginosibacter TaxID=1715720 RepID=A0A7G9RMN0_9BURK|nr:nitrate reductase [Diaphorobacter ruginosibacter]QNN56855.1 molybdopterin-dependent oxidoreductase [Diaphorobacter ruginosibacter]